MGVSSLSRGNVMAKAKHESLCGRFWENEPIVLFFIDQFTIEHIYCLYTHLWKYKAELSLKYEMRAENDI